MKHDVKISVLMPVFNGEKYLAEAVDSILNQTFTDFEFIIVNDGSTDATAKILAGYGDERIRLVSSEHKGLVYCLNKGLELSAGKYIARMDADDISIPQRLQIQYDFMESYPDIGICGGNYRVLGGKYVSKLPATDADIRATLFGQSAFCHPTVMLRKDVLDKSGLRYDKDFFRAEDYRLWIDLLDYTKGATIPKVLLHYRLHATNVSVQTNKDFDSKMHIIGAIQFQYMHKYGLDIALPECRTFAHFMDSSAFFFDLSGKDGKRLEQIITKILSGLPAGSLKRKVIWNICKILIYRAVKQKSILYCLKSSFYRKLFASLIKQKLF